MLSAMTRPEKNFGVGAGLGTSNSGGDLSHHPLLVV